MRIASSRLRVTVALSAGLFFYALSDILLWQRIFEQHDLFQFDMLYQSGHAATLVGFIAIGMVLLIDTGWWAIWYGAAFYTLTFSGLEDVLYYWLDGRAIPARCPWLDVNPLILFKPAGGWALALSAAVWIALWGASLLLLPRLHGLMRRALDAKLSSVHPLAIIRPASQLATLAVSRQISSGLVGLLLIVVLGGGFWFLNGTIGPTNSTVGLSAASGSRLLPVPEIVGPGQTAGRFSTWPANCRTAVLVLDFRDKNGSILYTGYLYLTPGGSFSLVNYWITPGVTEISTHMDCADNWPLRLADTRGASA